MILLVVAGSAGTARVAGGELRGGGKLRGEVVSGPRWFPIEIEQGEGFRGGRYVFWWREWRGGGSGGAGVVEMPAAAVFAGEEEDDPSGLSTTKGGSVRA